MGEHNSPAYADGRADHETRNRGLASCPPIELDTYGEGKWGGPWMYRKGWASIPDEPPHSCDRCASRRPDLATVGPGSDTGAVDEWGTGAVNMWA